VVKHLADCDKIDDEIAKGGCQKLFFDVKQCHGKPDQAACEHKATATWVVASLNAADDGTSPIIVVSEVPLLDGSGEPLKDKAGAQRIYKLAGCENETDKDSCRDLFIKVSNCHIDPPESGVDACVKDKLITWYDENGSSLKE
jgi:hypothetical protein